MCREVLIWSGTSSLVTHRLRWRKYSNRQVTNYGWGEKLHNYIVNVSDTRCATRYVNNNKPDARRHGTVLVFPEKCVHYYNTSLLIYKITILSPKMRTVTRKFTPDLWEFEIKIRLDDNDNIWVPGNRNGCQFFFVTNRLSFLILLSHFKENHL